MIIHLSTCRSIPPSIVFFFSEIFLFFFSFSLGKQNNFISTHFCVFFFSLANNKHAGCFVRLLSCVRDVSYWERACVHYQCKCVWRSVNQLESWIGKRQSDAPGKIFVVVWISCFLLKDQQKTTRNQQLEKLQMKKIESTFLYRRYARIYKLLLVVVTIRRKNWINRMKRQILLNDAVKKN